MKARPLFLLLGALAAAAPAALALDGPGREISASNALRLSSDTERPSGISYTKRFYVPYPGTVRVRWEMKADSGFETSVDVVGLAASCPRVSTMSTTYKMQTCILPVIAGDRIGVTVKGGIGGNPPALKQGYIRNVRLHFNIHDSNGLGAVEQD